MPTPTAATTPGGKVRDELFARQIEFLARLGRFLDEAAAVHRQWSELLRLGEPPPPAPDPGRERMERERLEFLRRTYGPGAPALDAPPPDPDREKERLQYLRDTYYAADQLEREGLNDNHAQPEPPPPSDGRTGDPPDPPTTGD
jgi:hypothetical protein